MAIESLDGERASANLRAAPNPNTTLPLVLGIATTVLCWAIPLGVPAIVFAMRAQGAMREGATDVARKQARLSLVLSSVAIVPGMLIELYLLIRHMAAGFQ